MSAPQPGTPLPWNLNPGDEIKIMAVHLQIARTDCGGLSGIRFSDAEANAAYIVHAANNFPKAQALADALRDALRSMEYWAGCDEGCTADAASSEIMGSGGAWPSDAYDKATAALAAWDAKP